MAMTHPMIRAFRPAPVPRPAAHAGADAGCITLQRFLMPTNDFELSDAGASKLARAHLWLGVAALVGSGLLAVVLVLSRTPFIADTLALRGVFRAALVVHVDLSVLIWFMAFAAVMWNTLLAPRLRVLGWLGWAAAAVGTAAMTVSPLLPDPRPSLNNYIPVLEQPLFLFGLCACGLGFGVALLRAVWAMPRGARAAASGTSWGAWYGALAGALAWLTLAWSAAGMPDMQGSAYYEVLFWGPGHVLQFQHALLAAVAWLWLAAHLGALPHWAGPRVLARLLGVAALPLLAVPVMWWRVPTHASDHVARYAQLMEWGHLSLLPCMLVVALSLPRALRAAPAPARSALLASLLLFAVGGVLAFMIRGANVVVPAHYHGSIVGVTLAFMGMAYTLLPRLGFREAGGRMARWQPWVYGLGQLTHITGLAWSGGYGVQRKVAGADQVLSSVAQKMGMGLMGLGGLVAIIGGVLFVVVCLRAMWPRGDQRRASLR